MKYVYRCALCGQKIEYEGDFNRRLSAIRGDCIYYICKQCSKDYDKILQKTKEDFFNEKEEQLISKFET